MIIYLWSFLTYTPTADLTKFGYVSSWRCWCMASTDLNWTLMCESRKSLAYSFCQIMCRQAAHYCVSNWRALLPNLQVIRLIRTDVSRRLQYSASYNIAMQARDTLHLSWADITLDLCHILLVLSFVTSSLGTWYVTSSLSRRSLLHKKGMHV